MHHGLHARVNTEYRCGAAPTNVMGFLRILAHARNPHAVCRAEKTSKPFEVDLAVGLAFDQFWAWFFCTRLGHRNQRLASLFLDGRTRLFADFHGHRGALCVADEPLGSRRNCPTQRGTPSSLSRKPARFPLIGLSSHPNIKPCWVVLFS